MVRGELRAPRLNSRRGIASGAELAAVDARHRGQRIEPGPDSSAQKVGILPQRSHKRERLVWAGATIESHRVA